MGDVMASLNRCFNPTLVRLRRSRLRGPDGHHLPFQSHAGSIEAHARLVVRAKPQLFQSHAGSIEASGKPRSQDFDPGFNPTLVRLRRPGWRCGRSAAPRVSIPRWFD